MIVRVFPSPVGELHFSMGFSWCCTTETIVSVPCRGTTFLNDLDRRYKELGPNKCFRPLSGNYISQLLQSVRAVRLYCSFRPLSGNYISQLSCTLLVAFPASVVSVPCRGTTFLNNELQNYEEMKDKRFRPLSGNYISQFDNLTSDRYGKTKFPSPVGELHFSISNEEFLLEYCKAFPSPVGELHFSIVTTNF